MDFYSCTIPEISQAIYSQKMRNYRDGVGWDLVTVDGNEISFYIDTTYSRPLCQELYCDSAQNGKWRGGYTILREDVDSLVLDFPDGNSFILVNIHNGFYTRSVTLTINGVEYDAEIPLML